MMNVWWIMVGDEVVGLYWWATAMWAIGMSLAFDLARHS
jgi:hypothetical protein